MQRVSVNNSNTKDYEICRLKTNDLKSDSNLETNKRNSTLLNQDSYSTKDERSFSSRKQHDNGRTSVWESYLLPGYCLICNDVKPPRCHYCPVCDVCVLKRDHHCYFAGSCVGWRNHRYFIVFCFWASLGSSHVSVHLHSQDTLVVHHLRRPLRAVCSIVMHYRKNVTSCGNLYLLGVISSVLHSAWYEICRRTHILGDKGVSDV
ncbi:palmitoyltransferase ZDHHC16-like [Gigantopelta aegis]|uniref:palmitoyltransferase ZDHHC16-like n=1 Tax=Gigantopelta aegis TaxID=1735272 RepID=UPI001B887696|nr:palmitoyltransferase ZDHHC16-like [Gigantopelta aegis]